MCQQQIYPSNRYDIYSQLIHVHIWDNYVNICTTHQINAINNVTTNTGVIYISHYWHMPLRKYLCQIAYICPTAYRLHTTAYIRETSNPVGFELSSNTHMYYAYGDHIYSLSSIYIYVFLVWQNYLCIYVNNLGNCTHMFIMPMTC